MLHADLASRPFPVFAKLAVTLRDIPVVRFLFAKLAAWLRVGKDSTESVISTVLGETPALASDTVATRKSFGDCANAAPKQNEPPDRETLIRRRWAGTGIKMWNPEVRGTGRAALNIQGQIELLPAKAGETLPAYDTLEFKLIAGSIVCEGVVVDPPKRGQQTSGITVH